MYFPSVREPYVIQEQGGDAGSTAAAAAAAVVRRPAPASPSRCLRGGEKRGAHHAADCAFPAV